MTCFSKQQLKLVLDMLIGCVKQHGKAELLKEDYSLWNLKILFGASKKKILGEKKIVSSWKGGVLGWDWSAHKTKIDYTLSCTH